MKAVLSDFKSTCVLQRRLPGDITTIPITYRAEGEDEPRQGATVYNVRVLYTNKTHNLGERHRRDICRDDDG